MTTRPPVRVSPLPAASAPEDVWLSRWNRVWLLLTLAVAFFARVNALAAQSLWNDEGTSVALARTSWSAIVSAAARDIHPPLYYLLLNVWIQGAGISEFALRFLSVIAGVLVVALTFRIAREWFSPEVALVAAALSALNPFQTYYAQETRMYIWVTLFACASVWAMLVMLKPPRALNSPPLPRQMRTRVLALGAYILVTLAALYTNYYAFTLVLFQNLAFAAYLLWAWRARRPRVGHTIILWAAAQVVIALAYAPWLLFARSSLTAWPGISEPLTLWEMTWRVASAYVTGADAPLDGQTLLVAAYLIFFMGGLLIWRDLRRQSAWGIATCALWAVVPLLATFFVSLTRPAYNPKFLLLATPGFLILVARGAALFLPGLIWRARAASGPELDARAGRLGRSLIGSVKTLVGVFFALGIALALQNLYADSRLQRDDYRGIVNYINAVATERDAVIVDAPGQLDAVRYYFHSPAQLVGLPIGRPMERAQTQTVLDELKTRENVYGIFWATEQADPERFVERYLAENTFKASDEWHGNVRLTQYTFADVPNLTVLRAGGGSVGDEIELTGYAYPQPPRIMTGFVPLELEWSARQAPRTRYKTFAQLLDQNGRLVSQRDTEPHDGFLPTDQWQAGETVIDRLAIPIPPGLAPGAYRVIVGMYRADDGTRVLTSADGDYFELGAVQIGKRVVPRGAFFIPQRLNAQFGQVELLGYEFGSAEKRFFERGAFIPLVLYFQARAKMTDDLQLQAQLRDSNNTIISSARALESYPTSRWDAGEIVRDVIQLTIPADAPPGEYRLTLDDGVQVIEIARAQAR